MNPKSFEVKDAGCIKHQLKKTLKLQNLAGHDTKQLLKIGGETAEFYVTLRSRSVKSHLVDLYSLPTQNTLQQAQFTAGRNQPFSCMGFFQIVN